MNAKNRNTRKWSLARPSYQSYRADKVGANLAALLSWRKLFSSAGTCRRKTATEIKIFVVVPLFFDGDLGRSALDRRHGKSNFHCSNKTPARPLAQCITRRYTLNQSDSNGSSTGKRIPPHTIHARMPSRIN